VTRFLNRTLDELDELYDFIGSQVRTDDVDLSSIQLVHQVERAAAAVRQRALALQSCELALRQVTPALPRLHLDVEAVNGTGAPATLRLSLAPWPSILFGAAGTEDGLSPNDFDLWLTEIAYGASANVVTGGEAAIMRRAMYQSAAPGNQVPYALLGRFSSATGTISATQSGRALAGAFTSEGRVNRPTQLFARPDTSYPTGWAFDEVNLSVSVSNNCTVQLAGAFVISPKGVPPTTV